MKTEILLPEDKSFFEKCIQATLTAYPFEKQKPQTDTIYHYCPLPALIAILESRCLWTSNFKFMNDRSEGVFLLNRLSQLHSFGLESETEFLKEKLADVFIVSFTERPDDLYQWKLYADQGNGASIAFSSDIFGDDFGYPIDLRERYEIEKPRYGLVKTIYSEKDQLDMLGTFLKCFSKLKEDIRNPVQDRLFKKFLYRGFAIISSRSKSEAWQSENEWRLVGFYENVNADLDNPEKFVHRANDENDQLYFRISSDNRLVPYYKWPFNLNVIKEIKLGPLNNSNYKDLKYSLRTFFISRGLEAPQISKSNIDLAF